MFQYIQAGGERVFGKDGSMIVNSSDRARDPISHVGDQRTDDIRDERRRDGDEDVDGLIRCLLGLQARFYMEY